jgi:hypothetical protein
LSYRERLPQICGFRAERHLIIQSCGIFFCFAASLHSVVYTVDVWKMILLDMMVKDDVLLWGYIGQYVDVKTTMIFQV